MNLLRLIVFLPFFLMAEDLSNSKELLKLLSNDENWVLSDVTDDGISIKIKNVGGSSLHALMVTKRLTYDINDITSIVYDVGNYERVLTSATGLETAVLKNGSNYLEAYQYISVPIPFFSDRQYCFTMKTDSLENLHQGAMIIWELLDNDGKYSKFIDSQNKNAQYLDFGAGIWIADNEVDGSVEVSYRLFMDIGGSVPKFVTEMINKVTIVNIYRDVINEAIRWESAVPK